MTVKWISTVILALLTTNISTNDFQLPSWLDGKLQESRGKTQDKVYLDSGCTLKIINNQCISTIQPSGDNCRSVFNFKKLLKGYWKLKDFHKLMDHNMPPEKFTVNLLTIDSCKETLIFNANNTATINFLDYYFKITDASLIVTFKSFQSQVINNTNTVIDLKGNVEFGEKVLTIRVFKNENDTSFRVHVNGQRLSLLNILSTFRLENKFYNTFCANVDRDMIDELELNKFRMAGTYNVSRGFFLSSTSILKKAGTNESSYIEIIIVRLRHQPIKLAVVLKGKLKGDILPFLSDLFDKRQRINPVIDYAFDVGMLTVANDRILLNNIDAPSHLDYNIDTSSHLDYIDKGINLQTVSSFENNFEKRSLITNDTHSRIKFIKAQVELCRVRDDISFNPKEEINLEEFLSKVHKAQNIAFPDWLKSDDKVQSIITKVTVTGEDKNKVLVKANIIVSLQLLSGALQLNNIDAEFLIDRGKATAKWDCGLMKQTQKLSSQDILIYLTCDQGLENFRIVIEAATFELKNFLSLLKIDLIPKQLKSLMAKVVNFEMKNFRLETRGENDEFIRFTGSPLLFGFKNLTMEGITWLENKERKLAIGIVLKDIPLEDIMENFIGTKLSMSWIGNAKTVIMVSNTNLESSSQKYEITHSLSNHSLLQLNASGTVNTSLHENETSVHHRQRRYVGDLSYYETMPQVSPMQSRYLDYTSMLSNPASNMFVNPYAMRVPLSPIVNTYSQQQPYTYYPKNTMERNAFANTENAGVSKTVTPSSTENVKTQDVTPSIKGDSQHVAVESSSVMDQLVQAYRENNQEKQSQNSHVEKELEEGVLDEANDKRSILTFGLSKKQKRVRGKRKHRKRSKINKRGHTKISNKASSLRRSNNEQVDRRAFISNKFRKDYLQWRSNREKGYQRENIANLFDDVYSENQPESSTAAYKLATSLTQEELSNYIKQANDLPKSQFKTYMTELSQYFPNDHLEDTSAMSWSTQQKNLPEKEKSQSGQTRQETNFPDQNKIDWFEQSRNQQTKSNYKLNQYANVASPDQENADWFDQGYGSRIQGLTSPTLSEASKGEGEQSKEEKQQNSALQEEGFEREAVALIPETADDVYNLYHKRHRPTHSEMFNVYADDEDTDDEDINASKIAIATNTGSKATREEEKAPPKLHSKNNSSIQLKDYDHLSMKNNSNEDEKQNNELIEEYERLNSQLAVMHEPTLKPLMLHKSYPLKSTNALEEEEKEKQLFRALEANGNDDNTPATNSQQDLTISVNGEGSAKGRWTQDDVEPKHKPFNYKTSHYNSSLLNRGNSTLNFPAEIEKSKTPETKSGETVEIFDGRLIEQAEKEKTKSERNKDATSNFQLAGTIAKNNSKLGHDDKTKGVVYTEKPLKMPEKNKKLLHSEEYIPHKTMITFELNTKSQRKNNSYKFIPLKSNEFRVSMKENHLVAANKPKSYHRVSFKLEDAKQFNSSKSVLDNEKQANRTIGLFSAELQPGFLRSNNTTHDIRLTSEAIHPKLKFRNNTGNMMNVSQTTSEKYNINKNFSSAVNITENLKKLLQKVHYYEQEDALFSADDDSNKDVPIIAMVARESNKSHSGAVKGKENNVFQIHVNKEDIDNDFVSNTTNTRVFDGMKRFNSTHKETVFVNRSKSDFPAGFNSTLLAKEMQGHYNVTKSDRHEKHDIANEFNASSNLSNHHLDTGTHVEIYNGAQLIGKKNITAGREYNITEEDEDLKELSNGQQNLPLAQTNFHEKSVSEEIDLINKDESDKSVFESDKSVFESNNENNLKNRKDEEDALKIAAAALNSNDVNVNEETAKFQSSTLAGDRGNENENSPNVQNLNEEHSALQLAIKALNVKAANHRHPSELNINEDELIENKNPNAASIGMQSPDNQEKNNDVLELAIKALYSENDRLNLHNPSKVTQTSNYNEKSLQDVGIKNEHRNAFKLALAALQTASNKHDTPLPQANNVGMDVGSRNKENLVVINDDLNGDAVDAEVNSAKTSNKPVHVLDALSKPSKLLNLSSLNIKDVDRIETSPYKDAGHMETSNAVGDEVDVNQSNTMEKQNLYEASIGNDRDEASSRSNKHNATDTVKNELTLQEDENKPTTEYSINEDKPEALEGKYTLINSNENKTSDDVESSDIEGAENLTSENKEASLLEINKLTIKNLLHKGVDSNSSDITTEENSDGKVYNPNNLTLSEEGDDDSIKEIQITNNDGSFKLENQTVDNEKKETDGSQDDAMMESSTRQQQESDSVEKDEDSNDQKPIEIEEGEDTVNLNAKALAEIVDGKLKKKNRAISGTQRHLHAMTKMRNNNTEENISNYMNHNNFLGNHKKHHHDGDTDITKVREVDNIKNILTEVAQTFMPHAKNRPVMLVKNKNVQVEMEIRPDSKTNTISFEAQGLPRYKETPHNRVKPVTQKVRKESYVFVDKDDFEDSVESSKNKHHMFTGHIRHVQHHNVQHHFEKPHHQKKNTKEAVLHRQENKKGFHGKVLSNIHSSKQHAEQNIDDAINSVEFDDSLVNHKYESIYRPKENRLMKFHLKDGSSMEDAIRAESNQDVAQLEDFEHIENAAYLKSASPRTNIYADIDRDKVANESTENPDKREKKGFNLGSSFTKMDDIIEAYQKLNDQKSRGNTNRNGNLDTKRASIPETSEDAYNLYNATFGDFGEDLIESDELKHIKPFPMHKTVKRKTKKIARRSRFHKNKKKSFKLRDKQRNKIKRAKRLKTPQSKVHGNDISKHLQEGMEGQMHYNNPIEEAIREYLYPDDADIKSILDEGNNDSHTQQQMLSIDTNKTSKKHVKDKKRLPLRLHQQHRHFHPHHHHKRHHQYHQHHQDRDHKRHNEIHKKSKSRKIAKHKEENRKRKYEKNFKKENDMQISSSAPTLTHHFQMNKDIPIKKDNDDNAINNDLFLKQESKHGDGNLTTAYSEDYPGNQKDTKDIMESFTVWLENKTTGNHVNKRVNTFLNNESYSTRKEVIGTTLKGKSKNLQFPLLTQQKRTDGKLHNTNGESKIVFKDISDESKMDEAIMNDETKRKKSSKKEEYQKSGLNEIDKNVSKVFETEHLENKTKDMQNDSQLALVTNNSSIPIAESSSGYTPNNGVAMTKPSTTNQSVAVARKTIKPSLKLFLTDELKRVEVVKGLSLNVELSPAEECYGNKMCLFIKENLDDIDALRLKGLFSSNGVNLSFNYPHEIELKNDLFLTETEVMLNVHGSGSSIRLKAELKLNEPSLRFKGDISVGVTGNLLFRLKMLGMWKNAFGIESLSIENADLSMSYQPGAPMPGFELAGDLWLGTMGSGHEIKTKIYFGFNPTDPSDNYLYGKTNKLSISELLKAFNKSVNLPHQIKKSGFPHGLLVAFTSNPKGMEIPKENLRVEFGFLISGTVDILGYKVTCKIKVTAQEIDIDIKMTTMEFANGLIKLHRGFDDAKNGPKFRVKTDKETLLVKAEGAAYILGIQAEAKLYLTNENFELQLKANIFDLIQGTIFVRASAKEELDKAKFKMEGCLSLRAEKLVEEIVKKLNELGEMAKKAIKRVKNKVKETGEIYNRAKTKLIEEKARIKKKESDLNSDTRQILNNRHDVAANCFSECPKMCQGAYIDDPRCMKTFGRWLPCRKYKSCFKRAPELRCILKCENEKFKKRGFNLLAKVGVKMKLVALTAAKISLKFAKEFVKLARVPMNIANSLLTVVERIVDVGLEVTNSLAKTAVQDVLQIQHFCMSANLGENDGMCVGYNLSITLFKKDFSMNGDLCLNGKMFDALGRDAIDNQYPQAKKMKESLKDKEKDFEKLDKTKEKAEKQDTKAKEKVEREKERRLYIPSPLEHYYERIIYEPEPTYSFHNDIISAIYGHYGDNTNVTLDAEELDLGNLRSVSSSNNSCENLTQTLFSYNEITKGLDGMLQKHKAEKEYLLGVKRDIQGLLIKTELALLNMSNYDQQQYDWYETMLKRSFNQWVERVIVNLEKRQSLIIPTYLDQLHQILNYKNIGEFQNYMANLHEQAKTAAGSKRSSVITTTLSEEDNLQDIKKSFDDILFKEKFISLEDKLSELAKIKRKLSLAQTFNKICNVETLSNTVSSNRGENNLNNRLK